MKNGLPIKPLQTLCDDFKQDIVDGPFGSELQRKDYLTKGVPVLKIQNVKPFAIELKKMDYVSPAKFQELRRHSYRSGDIVMTKLGSPLGVSAIVEDLDEGVIVADLVRIRAQRINTKYLCYHLNSQRTNDFINSMQKGTTRPRVTLSVVRELPIYTPSLPEQQRIVGILDEAFDGLARATANAEQNLRNARALFDAVLYHSVIGETTKEWRDASHRGTATAESDLKSLFRQIAATDRKPVRSEETIGHEAIIDLLPEEWRLASIEQLFNLIDYRGKTATKSGSGRRLITARNIRMGILSEEPVTFISEEQYKKWMVRGFPKPGDIFFVTEGHTMGFVALNTRTDEFALAQRTITLQPPVPFTTRFFFYFMLSSHFQKLVKLNATGAAAVGMKASKFRSLPLAFPSFAEQEIIADKLDALREETQRLESIYQQKLAALGELKQSLLHQAFSGGL